MVPCDARDDEVEVFCRKAELTTPLRAHVENGEIDSSYPLLVRRMLLAMTDGKIERSADASKDCHVLSHNVSLTSEHCASPSKA